jgi:hypothetical protein
VDLLSVSFGGVVHELGIHDDAVLSHFGFALLGHSDRLFSPHSPHPKAFCFECLPFFRAQFLRASPSW